MMFLLTGLQCSAGHHETRRIRYVDPDLQGIPWRSGDEDYASGRMDQCRRRTVMVFYDNGKEVEQLAIARYDVGLLKASWNLNVYPDQWDALIEMIKNKTRIKLASIFCQLCHADGLSHYEYDQFMTRIPAEFKNKVYSEHLAVAWI